MRTVWSNFLFVCFYSSEPWAGVEVLLVGNKHKQSCILLFLSNLYTQHGAGTHNCEIKSRTVCQSHTVRRPTEQIPQICIFKQAPPQLLPDFSPLPWLTSLQWIAWGSWEGWISEHRSVLGQEGREGGLGGCVIASVFSVRENIRSSAEREGVEGKTDVWEHCI